MVEKTGPAAVLEEEETGGYKGGGGVPRREGMCVEDETPPVSAMRVT